jgi:predicted hotdog family 3-hydroxylacyl-ACP dehydratase
VTAGVEILPEPALFEGHFPGRPILPGVALVELAVRAVARQRGERLSLRGVTHVRLRLPVAPGDRLWLVTREEQGGRLRIDLQRLDPRGALERIANGELLLGPLGPTPAPCAEEASQAGNDASAPPLDRLLPHRPPMRFVSALGPERDDGLSCSVCIPPGCALVEDGFAPALATVEAAAQTAAAWEAVRRARQPGAGGPRIGYLVALRDVVLFAARLRAGESARASVWLEAATLSLTHYRFEVASGGAILARGSIGTYLPAAQDAPALVP